MLSTPQGASGTTYTYEPFGKTTVTSTSANGFQYTGRENDGAGLAYYRARYYHSRLQRFISEDPIEFEGGDTNLYAYVWNSPANFSDEFGLAVIVPGPIPPGCEPPDIGKRNNLTQRAVHNLDCAAGLLPAGGIVKSGKSLVLHHSIPKQIQKRLPPGVATHPDVRGKKGNPNKIPIPPSKHKDIHSGPGRGGDYNRRFDEEIQKVEGDYDKVTPQQLNEIRDRLRQEFGF